MFQDQRLSASGIDAYGIPTVYMQEVNYGQESGNGRLYQRNNSGEQGSPAESGTNKVQQMQEAPAGSEVQQVPDTYSGRNRVYEEGVSGVRAGTGKIYLKSTVKGATFCKNAKSCPLNWPH